MQTQGNWNKLVVFLVNYGKQTVKSPCVHQVDLCDDSCVQRARNGSL